MESVVWDEKFNIGVEVVDRAHAKLFRIMKKLLELPEGEEANPNNYREGIKYLEAYSMTHFLEEETYMRSIRYKGYAEHKRIHDGFRDKTLVSLKRDLELSGYSMAAVQRFVGIVNNWLTEHIMREDQAIVGKAVARRSSDFSSQIAVISRAVDRASRDVLQLDTRLVSEKYKGQNIGNGFYCYQDYDMDGGIGLQILLGLEEPLLMRGVHRLKGRKKVQSEEVTQSDMLQVFTPLFQKIGRMFRIETEYEITWENLLDRDGFRTEFMKGYPCSLLFGTKLGNLIFCYRSRKGKKGQ